MSGKTPNGPHADVAERVAFLMETVGLDREGLSDALDGAVSPRSLFAILAGDRRPSRALAVLVERTFGFRADHLLHGTGPMWSEAAGGAPAASAGPAARAADFAGRSVQHARVLDDELERAEAWAVLWGRAEQLLHDLDRDARRQPDSYALRARSVLEECWRMAELFASWGRVHDQRRVTRLTRLFVQRFLVHAVDDLHADGRLGAVEHADVRAGADELLAALDAELATTDRTAAAQLARIHALADAAAGPVPARDLGAQLDALVTGIRASRPGVTAT